MSRRKRACDPSLPMMDGLWDRAPRISSVWRLRTTPLPTEVEHSGTDEHKKKTSRFFPSPFIYFLFGTYAQYFLCSFFLFYFRLHLLQEKKDASDVYLPFRVCCLSILSWGFSFFLLLPTTSYLLLRCEANFKAIPFPFFFSLRTFFPCRLHVLLPAYTIFLTVFFFFFSIPYFLPFSKLMSSHPLRLNFSSPLFLFPDSYKSLESLNNVQVTSFLFLFGREPDPPIIEDATMHESLMHFEKMKAKK